MLYSSFNMWRRVSGGSNPQKEVRRDWEFAFFGTSVWLKEQDGTKEYQNMGLLQDKAWLRAGKTTEGPVSTLVGPPWNSTDSPVPRKRTS